jgi:hypothetical protein
MYTSYDDGGGDTSGILVTIVIAIMICNDVMTLINDCLHQDERLGEAVHICLKCRWNLARSKSTSRVHLLLRRHRVSAALCLL